MAPREANNPFPDQYLTLDYDATSPLLPHDALPGGGDMDDHSFDHHAMENEPATVEDNLQIPDTTSTVNSNRPLQRPSAPVDPLSIDPTEEGVGVTSLSFDELAARGSEFVSGRASGEDSAPSPRTRQRLGRFLMSMSTPTAQTAPPALTSSSVSDGTEEVVHSVSPEQFDFWDAQPSARFFPSGENPLGSVLDTTLSDEEEEEGEVVLPDMDLTGDDSVEEGDELSSTSENSGFSNRMLGVQDTSILRGNKSEEDLMSELDSTNPLPNTELSLNFHSSTTVSDLKYFAERGCIVPLLLALHTPRLKTLGCRMLADYAKMPTRRVAVASNKRILGFLLHCMSTETPNVSDWMGREYAVETIRSLTATEESDMYLMTCPGMLTTLAQCARGGPFTAAQHPLASPRGRLHACIAIMNLSCGKSNKLEIAKCRAVLETMRDVMLLKVNTEDSRHASEARLKATTCIKNLSNADANDGALLGCPDLVEALGKVASSTCASPHSNDVTTTTNACLALMNLSISKSNKHVVFQTQGVMDALMAVISTEFNVEAKIKACSALSNLAIGYDNKIPMFQYPEFVETILKVIKDDIGGEARTKACSILWSFAAEMKNQVPVVQRGDILPVLVQVAEEDTTTEARFKCVAALTLLAESLENALPLLRSGALSPLMDILHDAGPDPTQWKGQTASWCVGFLMNLSQSDEAVPYLREAGVVELLAPLLTLNHYQSLKAAMAVTFVCRYDEDDTTYDLLRKTETVIPKIISLLHNTLAGRGGNGYKYGVFTLRSSVGCIASLASGPDFMKERIATGPVFESLLQVLSDFCVEGGTPGAIVGGGRDDVISATLAMRALHSLTGHLIPLPSPSKSNLPFDPPMEDKFIKALTAFQACPNADLSQNERNLARETTTMLLGYELHPADTPDEIPLPTHNTSHNTQTNTVNSVLNCCGFPLPVASLAPSGLIANKTSEKKKTRINTDDLSEEQPVRTFLLADSTGRRFAVPLHPSGNRAFNDNRQWCYRRGRFCEKGESPDEDYTWSRELQRAYVAALRRHADAVKNGQEGLEVLEK